MNYRLGNEIFSFELVINENCVRKKSGHRDGGKRRCFIVENSDIVLRLMGLNNGLMITKVDKEENWKERKSEFFLLKEERK